MSDIEVQIELQLENSLSEEQALGARQQEDMSGERRSDGPEPEGKQSSGQREPDEPLSLLADVALAPPRDDNVTCSCDCKACSYLEVRRTEGHLQSMQLQLQFLMTKADDLHDCLVNGQGHLDRDTLAAAVASFLFTCQPYFNHLESTARSTMSQHTPLPFDINTRLLDFSQQLCDRLEQLVLTYANYSLLSLDETEPNSMSHFCIGQSQLGRLRLTMFRYCKPVPFLAQVDTGLYKRMRWNVERLQDGWQWADEEKGGGRKEKKEETVGDTEYYFLCYEDIPNAHAEADGDSQVCHGNVRTMWSIGQWVQVNPDPDTENIYDWITCKVPRASYQRLLFLGSEEPSSCRATDFLLKLLLSHQTTE